LETSLDHVLRALGLEMGTIWLHPHRVVRGLPTEVAAIGKAAAGAGLSIPHVQAVPDWQKVGETHPELAPLAGVMERLGIRASIAVSLQQEGRTGGLAVAAPRPRAWTGTETALVETVVPLLEMAIKTLRAEEELRKTKRALKVFSKCNEALVRAADEAVLLQEICRLLVEDGGYRLAWIGFAEQDAAKTVRPVAQAGFEKGYLDTVNITWAESERGRGPTGTAIRTGRPSVVRNMLTDPACAPWREEATRRGYASSIALPLVAGDQTFGALNIYAVEPDAFAPDEAELLCKLADNLAFGIQALRVRTALRESEAKYRLLVEQASRRLKLVQALRNIDLAITGSLDLRVTFSVALDEITAQLGLDAAAILILNLPTQTLEYAAWRGFRTKAFQRLRLRLGEGYAGRAALERRTIHIPFLPEAERDPVQAPFLANEGFVAYYAVPLIAKGQLQGVLEVYHRSPVEPDGEWLQFLETLAGQAAIAIDNVALFDQLQRSHLDLILAYDATIEGWSRALDMRDKETEGHSQRVTEMSLRLARALGVKEEELVHIRRGALLHDIGKMGVPDGILLKPGPLTPEEWEIMRRHPQYAFEMLSPIAYLRPALDIPYCHHEKWDGTGYPRGLKGEQIPLAARIFAVVDVWDALSSDRPYRPAWPPEKVRAYLKDEAGKHFDPQVVEVFFKILAEEEERI